MPASETRLRLGEREYQLVRYPSSVDPTLRAWSAAEEHLLSLFGVGGPAEVSPETPEWLAVSQLWVTGDIYRRRTDVVGFVNGIPLLFME